LDNPVSSSEIYGYYQRAQTGELTGYANGFEREQLMKRLFLREYRAAEAQGDRHPKVLVKMGHWHIYRGVGPSHLQTLGNFLAEFAFANGRDALTVAVFLRGSFERRESSRGAGSDRHGHRPGSVDGPRFQRFASGRQGRQVRSA
jgi:hypothetical protein